MFRNEIQGEVAGAVCLEDVDSMPLALPDTVYPVLEHNVEVARAVDMGMHDERGVEPTGCMQGSKEAMALVDDWDDERADDVEDIDSNPMAYCGEEAKLGLPR